VETQQQISPDAIEEFKTIYQDEFGLRLSDEEAKEMALRLLRFFDILLRSGSAGR